MSVEENARAFQQEHGGEQIYTDYHEMLARENLDIVSICTWPQLHAEMVIAAAEAGVRAIHCEKPMAPTYGRGAADGRGLRGARRATDLQPPAPLRGTVPAARANSLRAGAIGDLQRLEMRCIDLFDWGTHWFDMCHFYNDETPAEWVLGQIERAAGGRSSGSRSKGRG